MLGSKRSRILAAVVLVAGAAGLAASAGSVGAAPSVVRLHMASDGRSFKVGTTTQTLTTGRNSCAINSAEPVIDLSSTGTQSSPGFASDSIGVRSKSGANGTPCSQVDSLESLQLKPGTTLAGKTFSGVRLDLEMTGDAIVKLTFARSGTSTNAVYQLQTGSSISPDQLGESGYDTTAPYQVISGPGDETDACAAPNSSGPNSGFSDNCQWNVDPQFDFDTITLTTVSGGSVSLEGGGDFPAGSDNDSLFYLSNSKPTPTNDTVITDEDTAVTGNVLTNDTDPDGNALQAFPTTPPTNPAHGTVTIAQDGQFTYTPATNYNGPDSFAYAAYDGTASTNATVNITVRAVNDAPVAQSGSSSTLEDTAVTVTIATDVDSTSLTAQCTGLAGGSVRDNGDGTITYTPAPDFTGTVTLVCTATDDGGLSTSSSATILVGVTPVNDPPVARNDTAEVDQNGSVTIPVLANDTDVDGDVLTPGNFTNVSPAGSTVVANADGTVTFTPPTTPAPGYTGAASFSYRASDGTLTSNVATVTLTVFPVVCGTQTVTDPDGPVSGSFTNLGPVSTCKRFALEASAADGTVLFQPSGNENVAFRGFVTLGSQTAPGGTVTLLLRYDPLGNTNYRPVQWCINPQFDGAGLVTSATMPGAPGAETWCVASVDSRGNINGDPVPTWQVFGRDDPRFR